jgi:hypothetical protein
MSESQNEYETEQQTDAEPTPGPWRLQKDPESLEIEVIRDSEGYHAPWHIAKVYGEAPSVIDGTGPLKDCATEDNARLIAAAGTAAQELPDEYDAVAAVEALSEGLDAARRAIIDLQEAHTSGPPEDSAEAAAQAASHRLKVFMAEAGADETMIPGDASVALASAEGSGDEQ